MAAAIAIASTALPHWAATKSNNDCVNCCYLESEMGIMFWNERQALTLTLQLMKYVEIVCAP
jgi:hypothetical protein